MKKKLGISKEEKIVVWIGLLLIVVFSVGGIVKSKLVKKEPYVASNSETTPATDEMTLKKDSFSVALGSELNTDAGTYVKSNSLAKVKLDVTKVDMETVGSYDATATLDDKEVKFKIVVEEKAVPVMKAARPSFQFIIESNSTMAEVKEYAGVSAVDGEGNDISANITGWDEKMPTAAGLKSYDLTVKDADGNSTSIKVAVEYLLPGNAAE